MTKRYRDEEGKLVMPINQIAEFTEQEGREYYKAGETYLNAADNREYVRLSGSEEGLVQFQSSDGYSLFIPECRLGLFLPDVASRGRELVNSKTRMQGTGRMKNAIKKLVENYDFESEAEFYECLTGNREEVIKHLQWRSGGGRMEDESIDSEYLKACEVILAGL